MSRRTSSKAFRQKLKALKSWMVDIKEVVALKDWWPVLKIKLQGHYRYYGVSGNMRLLQEYSYRAHQLAYKWVNRRGQRRSYNVESFKKYNRWNPLPQPRIYHNLYA